MTRHGFQNIFTVFLLLVAIVSLRAGSSGSPVLQAQGQVCGNPYAKCPTSFPFEPHDLPFVIKGKVQFKEYESNYFYAVVLKSVKAEKDGGDCAFVSEEERLGVQRLLPGNKVFASRCAPDSQILYDGVNRDYNILGVYGGDTKSAAEKVLRQLKSRYPDANLRRIRVIRGIT
ncbi:MAG TPA: hypothetical protein VGV87_25060 [Blastocatellia bacterium]|jgi:hypothetical protein|nr:hypothetical protein [Blastocatellia bacterium]